MRPTWHFVASDDIRWLLQLTAPQVNIKSGSYYRKNELDAAALKRSNKALTNALRDRKYLTRRALKAVLNQAGVAADDPIRLAHILLRAESDGVICSGPLQDNQFTYALLEERVLATKALDRDEALAKLTRRYFTSHGPAALHDFVWWSGLTMADAKRGIALVDRDLKEAMIQAKAYWSQRSVKTAQNSKYAAHLLPAYDEYLVAYKDRHAVLHPNQAETTMQGLLGPTVIVDGTIAGTWKRTNDKKTATVSLDPARVLNNSERLAVHKAADRYTSFLKT